MHTFYIYALNQLTLHVVILYNGRHVTYSDSQMRVNNQERSKWLDQNKYETYERNSMLFSNKVARNAFTFAVGST